MSKEQIEKMAKVLRLLALCPNCLSSLNRDKKRDGGCYKPIGYECPLDRDILRYCEALYNAGYRKQSEWISVDERLPETDNENRHTFNVLVYIPERDGCRQHGMYLGKIRRVKASDGKDNFWNIPTKECEWTVWGWSYFEHPVVTHWMPLPEVPKVGENDGNV